MKNCNCEYFVCEHLDSKWSPCESSEYDLEVLCRNCDDNSCSNGECKEVA